MARDLDVQLKIEALVEGAESFDEIRDRLRRIERETQSVQQRFQNLGRSFTRVGAALSVGLTAPLTLFFRNSLRNFDAQEKALAQVEAGIESTGNAAGISAERFQELASAIQDNSLFGDEEILQGVTAQLLTFTNIAGEQFERTQQAAVDLAARLGTDLQSASIQLGKALNDPVANLSALSRSGIQFSEEQREVIKQLAETNRLAEAQDLILEELGKQYGGAAEAAAQAGLGPLQQANNAFNDFTEVIGRNLIEVFTPLLNAFSRLSIGIREASPEVQRIATVFLSLAAAAGPALLVIGQITSRLPQLAAIGGRIASVFTGVNAIFALIAGTIAALEVRFGIFSDAFRTFANLIAVFLPNAESTSEAVGAIGNAASTASRGVSLLFRAFTNVVSVPVNLAFAGIAEVLSNIINLALQVSSVFGNLIPQSTIDRLVQAREIIADFQNRRFAQAANVVQNGITADPVQFESQLNQIEEKAVQSQNRIATALTDGIAGKTSGGTVPEIDTSQLDAALDDTLDGVETKLNDTGTTLQNTFTNAFVSVIDGTRSVASAFDSLADSIVRSLTQSAVSQAIGSILGNFGGLTTGTPTQGFAQGGAVRGPGTGTSDSILARLSNGEFVMKASAVRALGVDFLNGLNNVKKSPKFAQGGLVRMVSGLQGQISKLSLPRFQTGGLVNGQEVSSNPTQVQVNLQNNGSESRVVEQNARFDGRSLVIDIILEDLRNNGQISQGFQGAFGVRR